LLDFLANFAASAVSRSSYPLAGGIIASMPPARCRVPSQTRQPVQRTRSPARIVARRPTA